MALYLCENCSDEIEDDQYTECENCGMILCPDCICEYCANRSDIESDSDED